MSLRKAKRAGKAHAARTTAKQARSASQEQARSRQQQIAETLSDAFSKHATLLDRVGAEGLHNTKDLVHDFRVGTRQLLASLAMVDTICRPHGDDKHRLEALRKRLKKPFKALGPLRDLEVAMEHLSDMINHEPTLQPLLVSVRREYDQQARKALVDVQGRRAPRASKALARHRDAVVGLLAVVDDKDVGTRLSAALLDRQRHARSCWNKLRTSHPATFHTLRIAHKHLRYQSAFVADLKGPHRKLAKSIVSDCRTLQQGLGEIQDLTVLLQMARAQAQTPVAALRAIRLQRKQQMTALVNERATFIDTLVRTRALASALRTNGRIRNHPP